MGSGTNARRRRRLLSPAAPSLEVAFTVNLVLDEQYGASNDESANAVAAKALVANVADVIKNKVNDDTMIGDLMTNILAKDPSTPTVVFSVDHAKSNAKLSTMVSSTLLVKPTPSPREPDEDETHLTWIIVVVAISCTILACAAAVCLLYRKRSGVGHAHGEGGGSWSTPPSNAGTEFEMAPTTSAGRSRMHRNLTRDDAVATTRSTTRGVRGARGAREVPREVPRRWTRRSAACRTRRGGAARRRRRRRRRRARRRTRCFASTLCTVARQVRRSWEAAREAAREAAVAAVAGGRRAPNARSRQTSRCRRVGVAPAHRVEQGEAAMEQGAAAMEQGAAAKRLSQARTTTSSAAP